MVERQNIAAVVSTRENHNRCIGQSDVEILISRNDLPRLVHVRCFERRDLIDAACDFFKEEELRLDAAILLNQIVRFRKDEWRKDAWRLCVDERAGTCTMMILISEKCCEQPARVDENHSPKPSMRSPARSATDGSPNFAPGSGTRGFGG